MLFQCAMCMCSCACMRVQSRLSSLKRFSHTILLSHLQPFYEVLESHLNRHGHFQIIQLSFTAKVHKRENQPWKS
jgi:hypothetical protein